MYVQCYRCNKLTFGTLFNDFILCVECGSDFIEIIDDDKSEDLEITENLTHDDIINLMRDGYYRQLNQTMIRVYNIDLGTSDDHKDSNILIEGIWDSIENHARQNNNAVILNFRESISDCDITDRTMMTILAQELVDDIIRNNINVDVSNNTLPTSKAYMKKLRENSFKIKSADLANFSDNQCTICFEKYKLQIKCVKLPCNHIYHIKCINKWFKQKNSCPICRKQFPTDNEIYNRINKIEPLQVQS